MTITFSSYTHVSAIEVFRTDVKSQQDADDLLQKLRLLFPQAHFNFDLSDCDRIFRVRAAQEVIERILHLFRLWGHYCEVLND